MNTAYLLPYKWKRIGWILFVPSFALALGYLIFEWEPAFLDLQFLAIIDDSLISIKGEGSSFSSGLFKIVRNNLLDELIGIFCIASALMVAFSKQRNEDEFIAQIRLESLVWATYVNYFILALAILFIYGFAFFWVMVINMFTILLFFIIRFNWRLYRAKISGS